MCDMTNASWLICKHREILVHSVSWIRRRLQSPSEHVSPRISLGSSGTLFLPKKESTDKEPTSLCFITTSKTLEEDVKLTLGQIVAPLQNISHYSQC